jgi:hypothetical protein
VAVDLPLPLSPPPASLVTTGVVVPCAASTTVALLPGPLADPTAERVVRAWLADRGVGDVGGVVEGPADLVIRVGEPHDGPPGSYRLVVAPGTIRLAGADGAGVFYAAQVLRRLARNAEPLPGVLVEDAPAQPPCATTPRPTARPRCGWVTACSTASCSSRAEPRSTDR